MSEQMIELDPSVILADSNIRYAITKPSINEMKASIKEMGMITTPVDVEELDEEVDGKTHRLTKGFRRYLAALELNRDEGAGILLPAIVRPLGGDPVLRLRHQLSENIDRKSLSPMDQASAIKALLDAGVTKVQVRDMFKRPTGKNGEAQPASNAWLNMTLSFLSFPKPIRDKIHAGTIGVAAAYELTKVSPEKQAEVLERAENERQKVLQSEAKDEENFLKAEAKAKEITTAAEAAVSELDHAKAEVELARRLVEQKNDEAAAAFKAAKAAKGDLKKPAEEHLKAAEADLKGADKRLTASQRELEAKTKQQAKLAEQVSEMKARLDAARGVARQGKAGRSKGDAVGPQDVKRAAKEAGDSTASVKLNGTEMRKVIDELTLAGTYPKVAAIGAAIRECFDGVSTPGQMLKALATITGEGKTTPAVPASTPAKPAKGKK